METSRTLALGLKLRIVMIRMLSSDREILWLAGGFYLVALSLGTIALLRDRRHPHWLMVSLMVAGYLLQTIGLGLRGRAVQGCPIGNTFEVFQFTAWAATTLYLVVGCVFRLSLLGYFASCLSAVLTLASLAIPAWDGVRSLAFAKVHPLIASHAGLAIFAYGVFGMLALTSSLLLARHYSIQSRRLGGWFSFLPSLVQLDQIGLRLLWAGISIMALALSVGYLYWRMDGVTVGHTKLAAVALVWVAYLVTLVMRLRGRLVGVRFAWVGLLLYVAVLGSLMLVNQSPAPKKAESKEATSGQP